MKTANVSKTVDTNYKNGFAQCVCGSKYELGDGFNQHHIDNCPKCTQSLETRTQRKVIYWDKGRRDLCADIGSNFYFVLSNGINIRYMTKGISSYWGTERELDKL